MNKTQSKNVSTISLLPAPTVIDPDEDDLIRLVTDYCEHLEQGSSTTPEMFAGNAIRTNSRLLEMLQSVQLLHRMGEVTPSPCSEHKGSLQGPSPSQASTFATTANIALPKGISDQPGSIVGDYRILREIGRGAMGFVYEAEQMSLARRVAVKVLPAAAMMDERQIARFSLESQAAAKLHHSNIVPIYGVGNDQGVYYYSMQLIDHLPFQFPLEPNEVARIGECVARALHCAHQAGVIHRDIKPSNLLLDRQRKVWITDFGLARLQKDEQQTASGAIVGTMRYMSPEQACGSTKWVDHRTDIYALGVTMYEMLTGRCPYDAFDRVLFLAELEHGEPTSLKRLNAKIPVDLETIILKSMASHPDDRYATAEDLAADLERFLSGKVIQARRPSWQDRLSKWTRRNQSWVTTGIATWAVFTIGIAAASLQLVRAERATRTANLHAQSNAEEANRFFSQAREVVDHFGVSLSRELSKVPGAEEARLQVLRDTLRYYQGFIEQVGENPSRKLDVASTHLKIARIAEQLHAESEAILAYQQAESVLAEMPEHASIAALAANSLGLMLMKRRAAVQADEAFQRATTKNEYSISNDSSIKRVLDAKHHQAITLVNRAYAQEQMQQPEIAKDLLLTADGILTQLVEDPNVHAETRHFISLDRAKTLGALSKHYANLDLEKALALNGQAIECLEKYCNTAASMPNESADENANEALADWLVSLCNRARLLEKGNQLPGAIGCAEKAVELGQSAQTNSISSAVRDPLLAAQKLRDELLAAAARSNR